MSQLWPNGVMISDRDAQPDGCSCKPCKALLLPCWYRPRFFRDKWLKASGAEASIAVAGCCQCAPIASMTGADLTGGQLASFAKYRPCFPFKCGAEDCCNDVFEGTDRNGALIGKAWARTPFPCCCKVWCVDYTTAEVLDASGRSRFEQLGQPLCCRFAEYRFETTANNWHEASYPVFRTGGHAAGQDPVVFQTYRYWMHPCCPIFTCCRPIGLGIKEFPDTLTPEDQTLLLILVLKNIM